MCKKHAKSRTIEAKEEYLKVAAAAEDSDASPDDSELSLELVRNQTAVAEEEEAADGAVGAAAEDTSTEKWVKMAKALVTDPCCTDQELLREEIKDFMPWNMMPVEDGTDIWDAIGIGLWAIGDF